MDRAADLRRDYDLLGDLLVVAEPGAAASIARERRMIGDLLEALERTVEVVSVVDQLASRRRTAPVDPASTSRRRKSG